MLDQILNLSAFHPSFAALVAFYLKRNKVVLSRCVIIKLAWIDILILQIVKSSILSKDGGLFGIE